MNPVYAIALASSWFCLSTDAASAATYGRIERALKEKKKPAKKGKKPKKRKKVKKPKKKPAKKESPPETPAAASTDSTGPAALSNPKEISQQDEVKAVVAPPVANAKAAPSLGGPTALDGGNSKMSTGSLVGIIGACVGAAAMVAIIAMFVLRRSRKEKQRRIKSVLEQDFEEFENAATHRAPYNSGMGGPHDLEAAEGRWASELVAEELQSVRRNSLSKSVVSVNDTILLRGAADKNVLSSLVDMESDVSSDSDSDDDDVDSPPPRGLAAPKQPRTSAAEFEFAEIHDSDDDNKVATGRKSKSHREEYL
ncbi:hypothetical protein AC1031_017299 [Aphanomyces cochlioides]|nr:hypothetical protein AC1031_017299 [Aphanomyces cochlioides]